MKTRVCYTPRAPDYIVIRKPTPALLKYKIRNPADIEWIEQSTILKLPRYTLMQIITTTQAEHTVELFGRSLITSLLIKRRSLTTTFRTLSAWAEVYIYDFDGAMVFKSKAAALDWISEQNKPSNEPEVDKPNRFANIDDE